MEKKTKSVIITSVVIFITIVVGVVIGYYLFHFVYDEKNQVALLNNIYLNKSYNIYEY